MTFILICYSFEGAFSSKILTPFLRCVFFVSSLFYNTQVLPSLIDDILQVFGNSLDNSIFLHMIRSLLLLFGVNVLYLSYMLCGLHPCHCQIIFTFV